MALSDIAEVSGMLDLGNKKQRRSGEGAIIEADHRQRNAPIFYILFNLALQSSLKNSLERVPASILACQVTIHLIVITR